MLIGCTREQLEDREFKEKELEEEWWYYKDSLFTERMLPYTDNKELEDDLTYYIVKLTPRLLLQLLGTECGRQILHPNIWVNALMSEYKSSLCNDGKFVTKTNPDGSTLSWIPHPLMEPETYPNWIITDMRFPNELEAIKSRGGISIRVNRPYTTVVGGNGIPATFNQNQFHPSETALDNAEFDYTIENNSTIEDLIHTVSLILKREKII